MAMAQNKVCLKIVSQASVSLLLASLLFLSFALTFAFPLLFLVELILKLAGALGWEEPGHVLSVRAFIIIK